MSIVVREVLGIEQLRPAVLQRPDFFYDPPQRLKVRPKGLKIAAAIDAAGCALEFVKAVAKIEGGSHGVFKLLAGMWYPGAIGNQAL